MRCKPLAMKAAYINSTSLPVHAPITYTTLGVAASGPLQSAALGLAIAGALALGYANIFVTAPSPENLKTLFSFIFKVRERLRCMRGRGEEVSLRFIQISGPEGAKNGVVVARGMLLLTSTTIYYQNTACDYIAAHKAAAFRVQTSKHSNK
jgi:hypothetical protein